MFVQAHENPDISTRTIDNLNKRLQNLTSIQDRFQK